MLKEVIEKRDALGVAPDAKVPAAHDGSDVRVRLLWYNAAGTTKIQRMKQREREFYGCLDERWSFVGV